MNNLKNQLAYVVCLSCGSSFAIPRYLMPNTKFVCTECREGSYVELTAS